MLRDIKDCANALIRLLEECDCEEIIDYVCSEVSTNGYVEIETLQELLEESEINE